MYFVYDLSDYEFVEVLALFGPNVFVSIEVQGFEQRAQIGHQVVGVIVPDEGFEQLRLLLTPNEFVGRYHLAGTGAK